MNETNIVKEHGEQNEMSYYKDITNPKYVGPGVWYVIHSIAYYANTLADQKNAIKTITFICEHFPCEKCRGHAQKYIKENPMENNLMKEKKELSLFLWTWKFHNAVNYRIGKHIMSWEVAIQLYAPSKEPKLCSKDCSGEGNREHKHKKHPKKEVVSQTNLKEGTLFMKEKQKDSKPSPPEKKTHKSKKIK